MMLATLAAILETSKDSAAQSSSVDFGTLAPFITAISGLATGFFAARRSEKADKVQAAQGEIAQLITGYTNQISAYSSIVNSLQSEVARLRTQFDDDRKEWEDERAKLQAKIVTMEQQIATLKGELTVALKPQA